MIAWLIAAATAATFQSPVIEYQCGTPTQATSENVAKVNDAYMHHSVAIIEAAVRGDVGSLGKQIASNAQFSVFHGDVGVGPRTVGVPAALKFFTELAPERFQILTASAGPFSMDPCGTVSSRILLSKGEPNESYLLIFKYENGLLIDVTGSATSIIDGVIAGQPVHG